MSGYIGPLPVPQGIQRKQSFTATASQTTFNTNGYTDGNFINVYLNGVRLINGTDYTATNGSDIVLTTGASASDVLDFETFDTFELVNQTFENITTKNPTHEDTDGGRESAISFKGDGKLTALPGPKFNWSLSKFSFNNDLKLSPPEDVGYCINPVSSGTKPGSL